MKVFGCRADLVRWIAPQRKFVMFVTGPSGAGKSTVISHLDSMKVSFGIYPGRSVRQRKDLIEKVMNSDNPTACPELEDYIRDYVRSRMDTLLCGLPEASVCIDGMPRSRDQIQFALKLAREFDRRPIFLIVYAPEIVRELRLRKRGDDEVLVRKRMQSDDEVMEEVTHHIKRSARFRCTELVQYNT